MSLTIFILENTTHLSIYTNESYFIEIISDQQLDQMNIEISGEFEKKEWRAFLYADNVFGALHGLETFYQLVQSFSTSSLIFFFF